LAATGAAGRRLEPPPRANLIAERTVAAAGAALEVREIDRIVVAGHTHSEVIFEILGSRGELSPQQLSLSGKYLEGLAAHRERRWDDARGATVLRWLCSRASKASRQVRRRRTGMARVTSTNEVLD
jgi:hypothetical protein